MPAKLAWKLFLLTAALGAATCANIVTANTIRAAQKPWSEKVISSHIEQSRYTGELSKTQLKDLTKQGEKLFSAKFTSLDGAGRPMATHAIIPTNRKRSPAQTFNRISGTDANSCASCHNEPITGGAGNFTTNVFVSEGFTNQGSDSADPQFSNERNTNHLMGAGLIELLAREMTRDLHAIRKQALTNARKNKQQIRVQLLSKGVGFGFITANLDGIIDLDELQGIDTDLVIRPFSQKGVMTSLRQFTINALNQHHGMQATERFGQRWTGKEDFDDDKIERELTPGDISALVAWQATLPPPSIKTPLSRVWQEAAQSGETMFSNIGCTGCHIKALPLNSLIFADPGPVDAAGTLRAGETKYPTTYNLALLNWAEKLPKNTNGNIMVPLFGDLKRHTIADAEVATLGNELLSQRFVERGVFMTSELWGIGSTAPYGHRGDITTLAEVIAAHGGEARSSRDQYMALSKSNREAIIAYLKTLVIE